tara:strand:- start:1102 stop:1302 length:201 start_codon:yes stop_codon:yes gene_type:complete
MSVGMKKNKVINCNQCGITLCQKCMSLTQYGEFDCWLESVSLVRIKKAPIIGEDGEYAYGGKSRPN